MEILLSSLKNISTLSSQQRDFKYVSTGSVALDYVISGKFGKGGIPIPGITQFIGQSSTAKSAFATAVLANAQAKGYLTVFEDAENTLNSEFSKMLGLDPDKVVYHNPESFEEAFEHMEQVIFEYRKQDTKTPIVIVLDSLPVLCAREELDVSKSTDYNQHNMIGAIRAKIVGACLRKFDKVVKANKVGLVIINQIRSKVGLIFGSPDTAAAGGRSLDYYLTVNLETKSKNKIQDGKDSPIEGIEGSVVNLKNKCSIPFRKCDFRLVFNEGFDRFYGCLPILESLGVIEKNKAWYTIKETDAKFQEADFVQSLHTDPKFEPLRKILVALEEE